MIPELPKTKYAAHLNRRHVIPEETMLSYTIYSEASPLFILSAPTTYVS